MSRILIAYFSRAGENYFGGAIRTVKVGNTEIAANFIQKLTDADVYKIEMKTPYSQDYKTCVSEAVRDLKSSARPEIIDPPEDIHGYDTVILAYPSYCGTVPCAVFTNEGSGMGKSVSDIQAVCPGAHVADGLSLIGSRVSSSAQVIKNWLETQNVIE